MKSIRDWNGLAEFGINALTGEADRTGQRILCDLTQPGKEVVCDLLGLPGNIQLTSCWNSGVGSMMLPYNLFKDLAAWCLVMRCKCDEVFYIVSMKENITLRPIGGVTGRDADETPKRNGTSTLTS